MGQIPSGWEASGSQCRCSGALLLAPLQHDGDRHASVDRQRDGTQRGIAAGALIVDANPGLAWVCGFGFLHAQPGSSSETVVSHNDAAWSRQLYRPVEILWIGVFIGVDKNQVEWRLCCQAWQCLQRGADANLGAVIHVRLAECLT